MLYYIRQYGILNRVLFFCLFTLIGKPVIGSYVNISASLHAQITDHYKDNQQMIFHASVDKDLSNTEFFEEVEELLEDEETIHENAFLKQDVSFSPVSLDVNVIISSYREALNKHISKPRLYIKYSCLKSYILP